MTIRKRKFPLAVTLHGATVKNPGEEKDRLGSGWVCKGGYCGRMRFGRPRGTMGGGPLDLLIGKDQQDDSLVSHLILQVKLSGN